MSLRPSTLLLLLVALSLAYPAQAGTASNPEITDLPTDSDLFAGQQIPPLEITKGWVQPRGDRFTFNLEVAALDELPRDGVYVFHYSWKSARFYYRANWSADGSEVRWTGGIYEGAGFDQQGNRNYFYIASGGNVSQYLRGEIQPGAPARLVWSYPMDRYGEDRRGLEFKGMFLITYQKRADGSLQYVDTALADQDYIHQIYTPWWKKFTPGPSPFLLVAGLAAVIALTRPRRRT